MSIESSRNVGKIRREPAKGERRNQLIRDIERGFDSKSNVRVGFRKFVSSMAELVGASKSLTGRKINSRPVEFPDLGGSATFRLRDYSTISIIDFRLPDVISGHDVVLRIKAVEGHNVQMLGKAPGVMEEGDSGPGASLHITMPGKDVRDDDISGVDHAPTGIMPTEWVDALRKACVTRARNSNSQAVRLQPPVRTSRPRNERVELTLADMRDAIIRLSQEQKAF